MVNLVSQGIRIKNDGFKNGLIAYQLDPVWSERYMSELQAWAWKTEMYNDDMILATAAGGVVDISGHSIRVLFMEF
jgi:hypothetical protein